MKPVLALDETVLEQRVVIYCFLAVIMSEYPFFFAMVCIVRSFRKEHFGLSCGCSRVSLKNWHESLEMCVGVEVIGKFSNGGLENLVGYQVLFQK